MVMETDFTTVARQEHHNCRASSHMSPIPTLIPGKITMKKGKEGGVGWHARKRSVSVHKATID